MKLEDETMDIDGEANTANPNHKASQTQQDTYPSQALVPQLPTPSAKDSFREIQVKVHLRSFGKDTWTYQGRGMVTQEMTGHSSRVVVRNLSNGKVMATFSETSDLQAEKRGNFVVISCVDGSRVVSWSLNALNNSETLRLLASIELACYRCKQALQDPRLHSKARRKIERAIKEDRRKRHRRRKDQDAMIDAFAQNLNLSNSQESGPPAAS
ncbi:hypothetical protein M413DRAFT_439994 [Hebeloma cylindrosporum]|uniref:Uncharacterized protein n=1 Tax=Hebeloma cylindrosporum TaxID=76867 RepID=A0A0C2Z4Z3_HEBCY|nr:hypothetical protein M413DRAFT_439994 [Hebeloma cylindrosporum h7]